MMKLNTWAGSFNESEHRYFKADGTELSGITGMIKRMLFADEYKGVSQEVLAQAAERGHMIHSRVELFDLSGMGADMAEVANYARLKERYNLEWVASEYLVSDNENYATAIDKVYHEKDTPMEEAVLGDIKTTYTFNREYVSWQLSVEAYFFEMLNPHLKVTKLIGIWLREDSKKGSIAKIIQVERKPVEIVRELIRCAVSGDVFTVERIPSYISENLDRLIWIKEAINALTAEEEAIKAEIFKHMQEDKCDKVDAGVILFTKKAAATKTQFDTKTFKAEHSDLYEKYSKQVVGSETLQVKVRDISES